MAPPDALDGAGYRIGVGAGFAGDRLDPARILAERGDLDALVFECLAERTIALAQLGLASGSSRGYDPRMLERLAQTAPVMAARGGVVITNAGAANPRAAASAARDLLRESGVAGSVAAVSGDDVLADLDRASTRVLGTDDSLADLGNRIVSANAYVGAAGIVEALARGASIVITGRVGDASLFTAPLLHHYGQPVAPTPFLAEATLVGHLLECGGQLTGGYYADGVVKTVPDLAHLGFPFADVDASGAAAYGKVAGTGGLLSTDSVREQLYYEIDDPACYLTPDLAVDLSQVTLRDLGPDVVAASGARALRTPDQLKVSVGVRDGRTAVGEITYAGAHSRRRAELARDILRERWDDVVGRDPDELDFYLIGASSARPWWDTATETPEVRLRAALRTFDDAAAVELCREVEALYTNGPAGGGGVTTSVKETIGIVSALIPRELVTQDVEMFG